MWSWDVVVGQINHVGVKHHPQLLQCFDANFQFWMAWKTTTTTTTTTPDHHHLIENNTQDWETAQEKFSACQRRSDDDETDPSHSFQQLKNYPSKKSGNNYSCWDNWNRRRWRRRKEGKKGKVGSHDTNQGLWWLAASDHGLQSPCFSLQMHYSFADWGLIYNSKELWPCCRLSFIYAWHACMQAQKLKNVCSNQYSQQLSSVVVWLLAGWLADKQTAERKKLLFNIAAIRLHLHLHLHLLHLLLQHHQHHQHHHVFFFFFFFFFLLHKSPPLVLWCSKSPNFCWQQI